MHTLKECGTTHMQQPSGNMAAIQSKCPHGQRPHGQRPQSRARKLEQARRADIFKRVAQSVTTTRRLNSQSEDHKTLRSMRECK
eukprot:760875-Pleurochrysis_carterae.AAC.2